MVQLQHYLSLSALTLVVNAGLSSRSLYDIKEKHRTPSNWVREEPAPADHELKLHIGLKQRGLSQLERQLLEISSPSHPRYGQHLSAADVHNLTSPEAESSSLVIEWLAENDIQEHTLDFSPSGDWVSFQLTIGEAEDLLATQYHVFRDEGTSVVRTNEWSLPAHLHNHIDCIQPTTSYFGASAKAQSRNNRPLDVLSNPSVSLHSRQEDNLLSKLQRACNISDVTPACLRTLYGFDNYEIKAADRNSMALTNYLRQFNNRSDISLFMSQYRPDIPQDAWNFTDVLVAGGVNQQSPATPEQMEHGKGKEGNLDAEVMLGLAWPTPLTIFTTLGVPPPFKPTAFAPNNTNEPFLIWLQHVLALPDEELPKVISTSYGDVEHTLPIAYARRVCDSFGQLGARGVTVIFGSGDSGVGRNGTCHTNHNDGSTETPEFLTSFPDCCPYVTSVGATMGIEPEVVAIHDEKRYASGGGFSHYFARPAWQNTAVEKYLDILGSEHAGMFERSGAAYPDVSAQGYQYAIIWNGTKHLVDGTSASAPTFAAIVALLNDALLAVGRPVLGFLNPLIWEAGASGQGFTDITSGNNKGCNGTGFPATDGWDPASGWGTPVSYSHRNHIVPHI
ncbi:subtilisin-like protein [Aureobasidium sp. EXF-8845]|nr:subtilisin-like protein [Aureobasidium sp. EXF-8845]KAI4858380.1 subtilisin-like protein [Aureobasidium sp. EXF-8846]